ncbi:VG15 protein [Parafannyhessea umbonata]|uniref:VG15 protein n=1 Tax=Parafannyhessea umbonata TaxID=604330 RepID=UPI003F9E080C
MRISQGELDRYRAQIASRQDDARAYVLARLRSEARGLTVAEAREASIGIMQDCLSVYGDKAQALSAEMFDEICEAEGIDADPGEMFDDVIDSSRLAGKVHYYAGKLVDGDWDGYAGSNADLAAYYVHRSAMENMARNCHKNGVRYARVGTGRETCGWCFMLSSRGFDYRSEKTASAGSHEHCDCIIVPGVDGVTKIDGYDPKGMSRRWNDCKDTLGGDKTIRRDFDALTNQELSEIKGRSREQKWVRYRNRRVNQEVETRDNLWLYRGKAADADYGDVPRQKYGRLIRKSAEFDPTDYDEDNFVNEKGGHSKGQEWRDLFVHDALANVGIRVKPRPTIDRSERGITSPDVSIGGTLWEIKSTRDSLSPTKAGNELKFIKAQFREAHDRNFKNPLDTSTGKGMGDMRDKTRLIISTRYRSVDASDDAIAREIQRNVGKYAVEAIWVDASGNVRRFK